IAAALRMADGRTASRQSEPLNRWLLFAEAVRPALSPDAPSEALSASDVELLSEAWHRGAAGHEGIDIAAIEGALPSIADVGFKRSRTARQGLIAVLAFRGFLAQNLRVEDIDPVHVFVPPQNLGLLTRPLNETRLTRLCNLSYQLACAACAPDSLYDPDRAPTPALVSLAARVSVLPDAALEAFLPDRWAARLVVKMTQGTIERTLIETAYDALTEPSRLHEKWRRLAPHIAIEGMSLSQLWQDVVRHARMAASRKE